MLETRGTPPPGPDPENKKPVVIVTGSSGLIGYRIVHALAPRGYHVVCTDLRPDENLPEGAVWTKSDLTDDQSVQETFDFVRKHYGDRIASVVHLAAYYDFSGEESPMYDKLTVEGTRRLLRGLQSFRCQQFIFSSSLLVMASAPEGTQLTEDSPTDAEWAYPQSKLKTEEIIREEHGKIPAVILRIAGVYNEEGNSLPVGQHIKRIHEKNMESFFFPGRKNAGQAYVHLDDLTECFLQTIEHRHTLGELETFLIAEPDVMTHEELQDAIGEMLHGKEWPTIRIPKAAAKVGAKVKEKVGDEEEFIKPWMVDLADQHYPVDPSRARARLGWNPKHTLRETLPKIIANLKRDPLRWYEQNKIDPPEFLKEGNQEKARSTG